MRFMKAFIPNSLQVQLVRLRVRNGGKYYSLGQNADKYYFKGGSFSFANGNTKTNVNTNLQTIKSDGHKGQDLTRSDIALIYIFHALCQRTHQIFFKKMSRRTGRFMIVNRVVNVKFQMLCCFKCRSRAYARVLLEERRLSRGQQ